jgi:hypothetical protein
LDQLERLLHVVQDVNEGPLLTLYMQSNELAELLVQMELEKFSAQDQRKINALKRELNRNYEAVVVILALLKL